MTPALTHLLNFFFHNSDFLFTQNTYAYICYVYIYSKIEFGTSLYLAYEAISFSHRNDYPCLAL